MEESIKNQNVNDLLDQIEAGIKDNLEPHEFEVKHIFTKGMYSRAIFMPAGSFLTSKEHNTEHQYIVSIGVVKVYEKESVRIIQAPFHGVTTPGTRRLLFVEEDTIWTTFHPIDWIEEKDYSDDEVVELVKRIESEIINPRTNNLLNDKNDKI